MDVKKIQQLLFEQLQADGYKKAEAGKVTRCTFPPTSRLRT